MVRRPTVALTGRKLDKYLNAIARAGADAIVFTPDDDPNAALDSVGAVILGGGPDVDPGVYGEEPHPMTYGADRAVDEFEFALLTGALQRSMPVLAICRGIQVVNVAYGGSLHQHIVENPGVERHGVPGDAEHYLEHKVELREGSRLAEVMGATTVTASCHHHQAVASVGEGLRVTARAADGIVEALELEDAWLLAVQWHPEDTAPHDPAQQALFDAVVARAQ